MTLVKAEHAKGRRYEWNVREPDVHVIGDTAWIAYVNKGAVTDESGTRAQSWLESAFLERRGGAGRLCSCIDPRACGSAGFDCVEAVGGQGLVAW
ncbi:hypothetical protein [Tunturiibacter gelidoferens]|uniref:Uncharacterized protein n=1 Tax=Tunturiibacter lichenicola TaxID=2051959 RepID=A0A7Y9NKV2_9BACT|nr:hypothetical protein [Edaphobacter lichenicola]NYF51244.1 hypothetical protein [Edaphobacter lichenicola]